MRSESVVRGLFMSVRNSRGKELAWEDGSEDK